MVKRILILLSLAWAFTHAAWAQGKVTKEVTDDLFAGIDLTPEKKQQRPPKQQKRPEDSLMMARADSIYELLSSEDRRPFWHIYSRELPCVAAEYNHHFVGAALSQWQFYQHLLRVFGSELVDYYMADEAVADPSDYNFYSQYAINKEEKYDYPLANGREYGGSGYLYHSIRRIRANNSQLSARVQWNMSVADGYAYNKRRYKTFDLQAGRALASLHSYPEKDASLSLCDDTLANYRKAPRGAASDRRKYTEPLIRKADSLLAVKRRLLGPQHPGCALTLSDMAMFYFNIEAYDEARRLQTEALKIYRATGNKEALTLSAHFLSYICYEQFTAGFRRLTKKSRSTANEWAELMALKQQEIDTVGPLLGDTLTEVRMAHHELEWLKKKHEEAREMDAWAAADSIYNSMPDSLQAQLRNRISKLSEIDNRPTQATFFEGKGYYVRAAIAGREVYSALTDALGATLCDTLAAFFHRNPEYNSYSTSSLHGMVAWAFNYIFLDHSPLLERISAMKRPDFTCQKDSDTYVWKRLGKDYAKQHLGGIHKQFSAKEAQSVATAHRYPRRYESLAIRDDSLAWFIKKSDEFSVEVSFIREGIVMGERLLAEKARTIGRRHPCYALTLSDLSLLYRQFAHYKDNNEEKESDYAHSIALQREAIDIYHRCKAKEAERLSAPLLSSLYYRWNNSIGLSDNDRRTQHIQHLHDELALTRPLLGDAAVEVALAEASLQRAHHYEADQARCRHENGDNLTFGQGVRLYSEGRYQAALEEFERLSKKEEKNSLLSHYNRQWLAACHLHLGDTAKAVELDPYCRLAPVDRRKTVETDYQLQFGGDYPLCFLLARDSLGDGTLEHARMLLFLYEQLQQKGQYAYAARALAQAKTLYRQFVGDGDPAYADIVAKLGALYMNTHYYQEAVLVYEEAAAITALTSGKQSALYNTTARQLAEACEQTGDMRRYVKWMKERLNNDTTLNAEKRLELMEECTKTVNSNYNNTDSDTLLLQQTIGYLHEAIAQRRRMAEADYPDGALQVPMAQREAYYAQLRNLLYSTEHLMLYYKHLGQTDDMKRLESQWATWMHDSVDWKPATVWKTHRHSETWDLYRAINDLGWCHLHLGLFFTHSGNQELALEAIQRAGDIMRDAYYNVWLLERETAAVYTPLFYVIDIFKALALQKLNRYDESMEAFRYALRQREEIDGGRKRMYYTVVRRMVPYLNHSGHHQEAADMLSEWWDFQSNTVLSQLVVLNAPQRERYWNQQHVAFESMVPTQALKTGLPETWGLLYDNALLTKGLLLNTEMQIARLFAESTDTAMAARYRQLQAAQLLLMQEMQKSKPNRTVDTDSLQSHIRTQSYELMNALQENKNGDLVKRLRTSWTDVAKHLGKKDVAVEFIAVPMNSDSVVYCALTLRRGYERPHLTPLCTLQELKDMPTADYYGSTRLYDLLWRPLSDELRGCKNVYFSPIGRLHQIGIEYLPGMEQYNTYRLSSTRELLNPAASNRQALQAALYGGLKYELSDKERTDLAVQQGSGAAQTAFRDVPDLSSLRELRGAAKHMPVLEGTLHEVEGIDSLMRQRRISVATATGTAGTEESFKALSGQHKALIHISTHGFYQPEPQQTATDDADDIQSMMGGRQAQTQEDRSLSRSGLLMTGAADYLFGRVSDIDTDDGILTAREIARLDLSGLDLVVLSACETGLGDISGEGVFGLQRGFKKAGAQTLLVSLWKVEDDATQFLMTAFYRGLLAGKTKRQAFLDAQRALRQAEGGRFDRYECWASFVMIDAL